ncbi:hypothetical protein PC129_g23482 [Phytophthora cactorum]|uniref:Uncharacterized protein n=1 Tax=Phytophthora cactorum TaxID=29920 RepID=A0A329RAS7_9STRA|nr:hypothetical protein Pcac1_g4076 [Phytophthora cactorum]KAG2792841.1 hypothetical protein PC111_g23291 [Phytophthora cactorum]KAG2887866.1 hypothetical protein PC114_g18635 [Phytophthora cactorum]KAG2913156.1 hypothetical protein PC117_g18681 [Phytophthora cactorum]KAG2960735.1 hypothetical protein PC119_g26304 [Phytophthora cactorum]
MLATTATRVRNGKTWVPAINASDRPTRLPSKRELGTWVPLDDDVAVLEMNSKLRHDKVHDWLDQMIRNNNEPLGNGNEVHIGEKDSETRELVMKLLKV